MPCAAVSLSTVLGSCRSLLLAAQGDLARVYAGTGCGGPGSRSLLGQLDAGVPPLCTVLPLPREAVRRSPARCLGDRFTNHHCSVKRELGCLCIHPCANYCLPKEPDPSHCN